MHLKEGAGKWGSLGYIKARKLRTIKKGTNIPWDKRVGKYIKFTIRQTNSTEISSKLIQLLCCKQPKLI